MKQIVLATSVEEPNCIVDDVYLTRSLTTMGFAVVKQIWDDKNSHIWRGNPNLVLCRSIWNYGADDEKEREEFHDFLNKLSLNTCLKQLTTDYESLLFIAHKRYLLTLAGQGVATVPTVRPNNPNNPPMP